MFVLILFRFIYHDAKNTVFMQKEPVTVTVDQTLNSTYQTRRQLNLVPNEAHGQDIPPPLPAKQKTNLNNCSKNGRLNNSWDNSTDQRDFRPRTAAISLTEVEKHNIKKPICCKSKKSSNNPPSQAITSSHDPHQSQNSNATNMSNQDDVLDKPPPIPPKPASLKKHTKKKDASGSCLENGDQHSTQTENLSLHTMPPNQHCGEHSW